MTAWILFHLLGGVRCGGCKRIVYVRSVRECIGQVTPTLCFCHRCHHYLICGTTPEKRTMKIPARQRRAP